MVKWMKRLLTDLLTVQSKSYKTENMEAFIKEFVESLDDETITVEFKERNFYITKGSGIVVEGEAHPFYPCIVAHTDTVHEMAEAGGVHIFETRDGNLIAYDEAKKKQIGTGGDDKVGIFVALVALTTFNDIKVAFFADEEVGCVGSRKAEMEWFNDTMMAIQCDRKGAKDIIDEINGTSMVNKEFKDAMQPLLDKWGRAWCSGGLTDVKQLAEKGLPVVAFNMSCGYYEPHSNYEYVNINNVQDTTDFVLDIIETHCHKVWRYKRPEKPQYTRTDHWQSSRGQIGFQPTKQVSRNFDQYFDDNDFMNDWKYDGTSWVRKTEAEKKYQRNLWSGSEDPESFRTSPDDFCHNCGCVLETEHDMKWNHCKKCYDDAMGNYETNQSRIEEY